MVTFCTYDQSEAVTIRVTRALNFVCSRWVQQFPLLDILEQFRTIVRHHISCLYYAGHIFKLVGATGTSTNVGLDALRGAKTLRSFCGPAVQSKERTCQAFAPADPVCMQAAQMPCLQSDGGRFEVL